MASKILVADDSIVIQKSIGITFAQEDYAVEFVGNGEDALQKLQTYAADLVLADVTMPKMGGLELSEKIRGIGATQQTPILLLAGANDAMSDGKAKSCGANGFIGKPFDSNDLLQKVKDLLSTPIASAPQPESQDSLSADALEEADTAMALDIPALDDAADTASSFAITPDSDAPAGTAEFAPFNLDEADNDMDEMPSTGPSIDFGADVVDAQEEEDPFSASPTKEMNLNIESSVELTSDPFQIGVPQDALDYEPISTQQDPIELESKQPVADPDPIPDNTPEEPAPAQATHAPIVTPAASQPDAPMPTLELSDAQIENIVAKVFKSVIENIAWEVVPDMAEKIIRDEIQKLTSDDDPSKD